MNSEEPRHGFRAPTRVVCLIAAYFLAGMLGKHAAFMNGDVALVWPHSGIAVAAILMFGYRFLPGVVLGAFLFATLDGKPLGFFTVCTALGNCVAATICAYLLQASVRFQNRMERGRDAVAFVGLAAILGTTINALFNVASMSLSGEGDLEHVGKQLVVWWVPNAMGCLIVAPLLLSWSEFRRPRWEWKRILETLCCATGVLGSTTVAFESWYAHGIKQYPLAFLPYPFVVWAALRFGVRGSSLATLVVSAAAIHAVRLNRGPFAMDSQLETLLLVGCYIAVLAIANLLLAAAAAERSASERRYRAVVEDQTESICRFDPRGRLTFVNGAFCRARGIEQEELLGTSFLPQISAADMEIPLSVFLQLTPEDPLMTYDARVSTKDGLRWEQCTVRGLFDRHGTISEFQMVSQDITKRKQVEEALRASEEKIRSILADGILTLDENGHIVSCNPATEKIFGYQGSVLQGRPLETLIAKEDRALSLRAFTESLGEMIELRGCHRCGKLFPLQMSVSSLAVQGRPGHVVVLRDITQSKEVEEQLRHAQKLEIVGQLAGGVAHDFNNLLSVIVCHASHMLETHHISGTLANSAQQVLKAAERGARLTRQLLIFSRKQLMQPKLLDLNNSVIETGKMLQRILGSNIVLEVNTSPEPLTVRADEGMLDQVLMNLAVNARDAMSEGGRLTLRTRRVELTERAVRQHGDINAGAFGVISVTDTGCGIPTEILNKIFEPFFTTKDVGKGTGLGLSTVHGIMKQHKGAIEVSTQPGKGTTFDLYWPLHEEEAPAQALPGTTTATVVREIPSPKSNGRSVSVVTSAS